MRWPVLPFSVKARPFLAEGGMVKDFPIGLLVWSMVMTVVSMVSVGMHSHNIYKAFMAEHAGHEHMRMLSEQMHIWVFIGAGLGVLWSFALFRIFRWYKTVLKAKADLASRHELQKRTLAEMVAEKNLLDTLLNHIPMTVFAKDVRNDYRYVSINKGAEKSFGVTWSEIMGKTDYDLPWADDADFFRNTDEAVIARGRPVEIERETVTTSNGQFIAHTVKVPIYDESGEPTLLLGIAEDVTERMLAQDELRRAKEKAERANHVKTEFLNNICEEIRQPLTGILALNGVLSETELDDKQSKLVSAIGDLNESLLQLLKDMRDFSMMEAGELRLSENEFDIHLGVQEAVHGIELLSDAQNMEIACNLDDRAPRIVVADHDRLLQILTILMGSLARQSRHGILDISMNARPIEASTYLYNFIISSTGAPVLAKYQRMAFLNPADREYSGTGLIMGMAADLVAAMKGELSIHGNDREAVYTVSIPLKVVIEEA